MKYFVSKVDLTNISEKMVVSVFGSEINLGKKKPREQEVRRILEEETSSQEMTKILSAPSDNCFNGHGTAANNV